MNKPTKAVAATLILSGVLASGCASIVSGTSQTLHVQAVDAKTLKPIADARCTVRDSKGNNYPISSNPGTVDLGKGQGTLQTTCTAPSYHQAAIGTGQSFDAWTIGNIIFWPGVFVDIFTGAIQKYPDYVTVVMSKNN